MRRQHLDRERRGGVRRPLELHPLQHHVVDPLRETGDGAVPAARDHVALREDLVALDEHELELRKALVEDAPVGVEDVAVEVVLRPDGDGERVGPRVELRALRGGEGLHPAERTRSFGTHPAQTRADFSATIPSGGPPGCPEGTRSPRPGAASRPSRPCTCRRRARAASAAGSSGRRAASGARRTRRRARSGRPRAASARPWICAQPVMPGPHVEPVALPLVVPLDLVAERRPRPDQAHLAADDVPELRQLVDREPAQHAAGPRDPRVAAVRPRSRRPAARRRRPSSAA